MRLDRFMSQANAAYYASRDFTQDFATAPELTPAFGELLGAWAAVVWAQCGAPRPVLLAEAGPGRGTLMRGALRAAQKVPAFHEAIELHAIETSPRFADTLPFTHMHAELATLPQQPMILLANEFLDALPVRQFVRRKPGWMERYVADGKFIEQPSPFAGGPAPEGAVLERGEAALAWTAELAARLRNHGGAALILDYGAAHGGGDTLQAIRGGRAADPLADPGEADLTAHVDYGAIAEAVRAAGAAAWGPVPQGAFLQRIGLRERTAALAAANPAQAAALRAAADRLTAPDAMGTLFKAFAITRREDPAPPGFEP